MKRVPMPRRRAETPAERRFRADVRKRAAGRCEGRVPGVCWGSCDPLFIQAHHVGGRVGEHAHDAEVNGLGLCPPCHDWVTTHPSGAYELGLMARRNGLHNPATSGRRLA